MNISEAWDELIRANRKYQATAEHFPDGTTGRLPIGTPEDLAMRKATDDLFARLDDRNR